MADINNLFRSDLEIAMDIFKPVLMPVFRSIVKECLDEFLISHDNESMLTRQEAKDAVHVCLSTIINWERKGKLTPHKVGKKVMYKRVELEKLAGYGS